MAVTIRREGSGVGVYRIVTTELPEYGLPFMVNKIVSGIFRVRSVS